MLGRGAQIFFSILATTNASEIFSTKSTCNGVCWVPSRCVIQFPAADLRHTVLAELAESLAEARNKLMSALWSRERVSISSRRQVIRVANRGQSARSAVGWKSD